MAKKNEGIVLNGRMVCGPHSVSLEVSLDMLQKLGLEERMNEVCRCKGYSTNIRDGCLCFGKFYGIPMSQGERKKARANFLKDIMRSLAVENIRFAAAA